MKKRNSKTVSGSKNYSNNGDHKLILQAKNLTRQYLNSTMSKRNLITKTDSSNSAAEIRASNEKTASIQET
ncbi:hypothetical protein Csa_005202, partial [Cucumis sativus]